MTKEEFETYRFSINTQIKINNEWHKITDVDFNNEEIWYFGCGSHISISDIQEIKD